VINKKHPKGVIACFVKIVENNCPKDRFSATGAEQKWKVSSKVFNSRYIRRRSSSGRSRNMARLQ
jgi:hypothetical protein